MVLRHLQIIVSSFALVLFITGTAYAAGAEHTTDWWNLFWRFATLGIVILIIYKMAGKAIANTLTGRRSGIAQELTDLDTRKEKAREDLLLIEKRIASLSQERAAILAEYETRGEALKAEIIAKAEESATQIMTQAKQTAQNEIDSALASMRESLAEKIIEAASGSISSSLTPKDQEKLLSSSLTKVVLQ